MQRDYHRWYSHRLGIELGVVVYGHWGSPVLGFPTSAGDEMGTRRAGTDRCARRFIDGGRIKFYSVIPSTASAFTTIRASPFIAVMSSPFSILFSRGSRSLHLEQLPIASSQSPRWARPSARITPRTSSSNILTSSSAASLCRRLRPPQFHGRHVDDNFYFNNPWTTFPIFSDPWVYDQLASSDIHLTTGTAPGKTPARPIISPASSRTRASAIRSTIGAPWAATTGLTGSTRCANTFRTCTESFAGTDYHNLATLFG